MHPIITVTHLRKRYGSTLAVDDVSFDVHEGEIFGIIGPNGAGKTTTVECVQGLRPPDSGSMRVLGMDPMFQAQELRRHIGSQLQESALPDRLRVGEALDLFASFSHHPVQREVLLERWGLAGQDRVAFGDLSGGQRQRLFIALAFINDPEIVFLDELTQGLDPQARRTTWGLIQDMRDQGKTVILVTHFMDEAEELCDRVAVIDGGRVVALDTPQQLIDALGIPIHVRFSSDDDVSFLSNISEVDRVHRHGNQIQVEGNGAVLALVAAALVSHGIIPPDLRADRPTLEDAFIALTGQSIRT
jgi:ABC-2 type transport system ATP-binding protein